jgi:hypothetical protein
MLMTSFAAILGLFPAIALGQVRCGISYEDQNQVDYNLRTRHAWGVAIDASATAVPKTCLGIFREPDHRLISSVESDENGQFDFGQIKRGKYRLVARYDSLGVANVILDIGLWPSGGVWRTRRLFVHLRPRGIDAVSFISWNRR